MVKARPVIWNGMTYASMAELAREKGVSREAVRKWIDAGYTRDEDRKEGSINDGELTIRTGIDPPAIRRRRSVYAPIRAALAKLPHDEWMVIDGLSPDGVHSLRASLHVFVGKRLENTRMETVSDLREDGTVSLYVILHHTPPRVNVRPYNGHKTEPTDA